MMRVLTVILCLVILSGCAFFFDIKRDEEIRKERTYSVGSKPTAPDSIRIEKMRMRHERKMAKLKKKKNK